MNNDKQLIKVISALKKVNPETQQMAIDMAKGMGELEIIQHFNQKTLDLFSVITKIVKEMGRENVIKFGGYKVLLENALKINVKLPVDNFTLFVLEFVDKIYEEKEDFFLTKKYGDATLAVGNEFAFIRSEPFIALWSELPSIKKNEIKEAFIMVTTYAHVYFMKTVLSALL